MATTILLLELAVVLAMIFIGARMGGIGLGIFGMLGVFVLVYGFGLKPGSAPIDVMMIILAVVTAAAALQAAGGLEYLVGQAAIFLRKHPHHITYYGPLCTWLFCLVAGTAHTCYSLLPIISEIAQANKIRPERPLSLAVISASLGITGSPVSAATAAIISQDLLGGAGVELGTILMVCVPASLVSILVAAFIQNRVGKALEDDPEYQRRVREGLICPEKDVESLRQAETMARPEAKYSVWVFLFGVALVVLFGFQPQLRPEGVTMSETIEMIMMADVILIMLVGKVKVGDVTKGSVFAAGINAVIAIFGIAWMGSTFYTGNAEAINQSLSGMVAEAPFTFAVALFVMSVMLFLPGRHRHHPLSRGYSPRHQSAASGGHVSRRQWLFLPPQLSYGGSCHQLRPHGDHVRGTLGHQPFVSTARLRHHVCGYRRELSHHAFPLSPL